MRTLPILGLLAWRNLWRNHRRTLIMLSAISVGVWAMIFMIALMRGMVEDMLRDGIAVLPGHVQVHHRDFLDDPSVSNVVPLSDSEIAAAMRGAGVERWGSRVRVPAGQTLSLADNDTIQDFGGNSLAGFGDNGDAAYDGITVVGEGRVTLTFLGFDGGGAPIVQIDGPAGAAAVLQWSSDLVVWNDVGTFAAGESHTDSGGGGEIRRFYRLVDPGE